MPELAYSADKRGEASAPADASAEFWLDQIKRAKDSETQKKRATDFKLWRQYVKGEAHDDGKGGLVRTNLIQVNQSTIVPHIYAKDPEISVSPSRAVDQASYRMVKTFARTLETVLHRMLILDARLKKRARSNLYSILTTGEGWLKMLYQRDYETDPIIKARIQDSQDNLKELQKQLAALRDPDRIAENERLRYDTQKMLEALEAQVEVVAAEGLVIDRIRTDDILVLDGTLFEFDGYVDADAIAHGVWMSKDDYANLHGGWPKDGAPTLHKQPDATFEYQQTQQPDDKDCDLFVRVWEVWDKAHNVVRTVAEGATGYCREPYAPQRLPERWYPFYRWGWNFVDGEVNALSDVAMQKELQDEYNTTRTNFAEHRKASVPVRVVRGGGNLTQEDIERIQARRINQFIVIPGASGVPIENDVMELSASPIDPQVYDTSPIRADMELVSGRGDAAAGTVQEAKTATEAEILQAGLVSRSDYRRDLIEDGIQEMAQAAAEILLQELTPEQVGQIAGANFQWPTLSRDEVFNLIQIEIRAGSTGRPNKNKEIEQWQTLLPLLQQALMQVNELRMQGNFELAEANIKLVKETMRRFDERIDLEEYFGPEGEEGQAQLQQTAMLQQQVQEMAIQLQAAQEQLAQVDQQKMAKEQQDADARGHERMLKEREYEDRKAEREMAIAERNAKAQDEERRRADEAVKRDTEAAGKVQTTREGWDREDQRAEQQRQHELAMKAADDKIAQLTQEVDALRKMLEEDKAEDDGEGESEDSKLAQVLDRLATSMEKDAEEKRATRERVMGYLEGKDAGETPPTTKE